MMQIRRGGFDGEAHDLGETVDHAGNVVECVVEVFSRRHVGLAESRKVRRDAVESIREERGKIAEHVTGARKAV